MSYSTRCSSIQKYFFFFFEDVRVHYVEFFESKEAQIGINIERTSVLNMLVMVMMVMMTIEFGKFFRYLNAHKFLFCEWAAHFVMTVVFMPVIFIVSLMMNLMVALFSHVIFMIK
jgi:hypothetical protein